MKQRHKKDAMKQRHQKVIQAAKDLSIQQKMDKPLDKKYKGKILSTEKTTKA